MLSYFIQLLFFSQSMPITMKGDYQVVMNFINDTRTGNPFCAYYIDYLSFALINSTCISNTGDSNEPGGVKSSGPGPVVIINTVFTDNKGRNKGGAIYLEIDTFEINSCSFTRNQCDDSINPTYDQSNGGAIYLRCKSNCIHIIKDCIFTENTATTSGGSIFIEFIPNLNSKILASELPLQISNNYFINSQTKNTGGAICIIHENGNADGDLIIENCTFFSCFSDKGGSLHFEQGKGAKSINNCIFENDTATYLGGAICIENNALNITDCIFLSCRTFDEEKGEGGSIYFNGTRITSYFEYIVFDNCSSSQGGAISLLNNTIQIENSNFTNCKSSFNGGSICSKNSNTDIDYCNLILSESIKGSAIYHYSDDEEIDINHCIFKHCFSRDSISNCEADGCSGGAFYISSKFSVNFLISNSFENCTSSYSGGALCFHCHGEYDYGYIIQVIYSNFTRCKSGVEGGAISGGIFINCAISGCLFIECESQKGGALYFKAGTKSDKEIARIAACDFINCFATSGEGYAISSSYCLSRFNALNFKFHKRSSNSNNCVLFVKIDESRTSMSFYSINFIDNSGISAMKLILNNSIEIINLLFTDYDDNLPCINFDDWDINGSISLEGANFTNIKNNHCMYLSEKKNNIIFTDCCFVNISCDNSCIYCTSLGDIQFQNFNFTDIDSKYALYLKMEYIFINQCNFINCHSTDENNGNTIYLDGIKKEFRLNFENNTFNNCSYANNGAALFLITNTVNRIMLNDSSFTECKSSKEGGAIYSELIENGDGFSIMQCSFNQCKSKNGGGAISTSANYQMFISHCSFQSNIVDDGNGGSILVSAKNDSQQKLQYCRIAYCNFTSNKGKDGFAIYIEDNDNQSDIKIHFNNFIDNYNKETIANSFIIFLEFCCVSSEQIFSENSFINQENGVNITVNEFSCSDIKIQTSSENFAETSMSNSDENTQDLLSFEQTETESTSLIEKSTNSEANEIESSINFVQTESETTKSTFTDFEKSQSQPNEISDSISISFQSTKDDSLIENGSNKNKGSNIGMIVGIICGVVVVVAIAILVTLLVLKKKKKTNKEINLQTPNSNKKHSMKEETNLTDDDDSDLNFWL